MRSLNMRRLADLEAAAPSTGAEHWISTDNNWDRELVLDHYGRERIGPNDTICWILWSNSPDEAPVYPAGWFDQDGRWADLCKQYGYHHRDHESGNRYRDEPAHE